LLNRGAALNYHNTVVYADQRINTEPFHYGQEVEGSLCSFFNLLVGGRGQPMLAGGSGGGHGAEKAATKRKVPMGPCNIFPVHYTLY
jgi:hypothetical protein